MSVVASAETTSGPAEPSAIEVPISGLQTDDRIRSGPLDEAHIARLMELEGRWPPLLVWAAQGRRPGAGVASTVLDGSHRLEAARRLGHHSVVVTAFEGGADDAFIESVRRNVAHGLPLSRPDRLRAGRRILRRHPGWSDRRIGGVCALSAHTVARLRAELEASARGRLVHIDGRLGRDGRVRPAQPGSIRGRVVDAIRANPTGSLREVAAVARVSPETVRRVRRDLQDHGDMSRSSAGERGGGQPGLGDANHPGEAFCGQAPPWRDDPCLASSPELTELLAWLETTDPGESAAQRAGLVPLSRVYEVADEARRRAEAWTSLARALEARARAHAPLRG